jgi:acyl carrier protein
VLTPSVEEIERTIEEEILHILDDKGVPAEQLPNVVRDDRLGELGLTSLDLAQLVAGLEARLHADPFAELVAITSVRTVADLCRAYERFFAGETSGGDEAVALDEVRRRAQARRGAGGR